MEGLVKTLTENLAPIPENAECDEKAPECEEEKQEVTVDDAASVASDDSVASAGSGVTNINELLQDVPEPVPCSKTKTKAQLIESILKITDKYSHRKLTRMRKAELEDVLGETYNEKICEAFDPQPEEIPPPEKEYCGMNKNQIAELLYSFVQATCNGVERLSQTYSHKIGGFYVEGWGLHIHHNPQLRELLKESLFEVFEDNATVVMPYLTKSGRIYTILLMSLCSSIRRK